MSLEKKYYYKINVREGAPGFADDETYRSSDFNDIKECYKSYLKFNPSKYYTHFKKYPRRKNILC